MNTSTLGKLLLQRSTELNSDFFILSSGISDFSADTLIDLINEHSPKRKNIALILTTLGGDPDAGYRIVRAIRRKYEVFNLFVFGSCKSTGTLIALGADNIYMGDFGEFGPLDIQLTKDDELINTSGLSYLQSLESLDAQMFRTFEANFLRLKQRSGHSITTKTAAEISSKLAVGLISEISAQIDPVKLGEVNRAIKIADGYGSRICNDSDLVRKLIFNYPSHGFVIDYQEAAELFPSVQFIGEVDSQIETELKEHVRTEGKNAVIDNLNNIINMYLRETVASAADIESFEPVKEEVKGDLDKEKEVIVQDLEKNEESISLNHSKIGNKKNGSTLQS